MDLKLNLYLNLLSRIRGWHLEQELKRAWRCLKLSFDQRGERHPPPEELIRRPWVDPHIGQELNRSKDEFCTLQGRIRMKDTFVAALLYQACI